MRALIIALVVALLLTAPLLYVLTRRLTRPLSALARTAELVSQGDLEHASVDVDAPGEIGQLAESFSRAIVATRYFIQRVEQLEAERDASE